MGPYQRDLVLGVAFAAPAWSVVTGGGPRGIGLLGQPDVTPQFHEERFEHGLRREQAIELRDMVAAFMTPEQLEEAERMAEARQAEWE